MVLEWFVKADGQATPSPRGPEPDLWGAERGGGGGENDLRAAQAQKLSTLLLSCFGSDSALTLTLPRVRPGTLERDLCE